MNQNNKEIIQQLLEELKSARKDMERFRKEIEHLGSAKYGIYDKVKETSKWNTEIS